MADRRAWLWLVVVGLGAGLAAGCSDDTSPTDVPREDGAADADGRDDGDTPPTEGGDGDADVDGREAFDGTCTTHEQCQDGLWCNGAELCEGGTCIAGAYPCDDGIDCTVDSCDEDLDRCYHPGDDSLCQNHSICDGEEQCEATGCSTGAPPDCGDTTSCTIDSCDDTRGGCVHDDRDLDGDTFMTSLYGCDVLGGRDCDDSDPLINPDADEVCDDDEDNDCDGLKDFNDPSCWPVNDTCTDAITLEEATSVVSSTRGTNADYTIPCSWSRYEDVTFAITLTEHLDVIVDASARSGGTLYVDFERTCGVSSSSMRCQSGTTTSLRRNGLEPGTYYVVVQGSGGVDFTISYRTESPTPIPPNDVCSGAIDIPAAGGVVTGTLLDTSNHYVPGCAGTATYPDAFYRLVLTEPKKITVTGQLSPTSWNTYVSLMTTCGDASTELGCANGATATLTRNFLDAGTYYLAVDANAENPFTLAVRLDPPIYPPANDLCPGTNVSGGGVFVGTMVDTYRDYPPSCSTASLSDVVYEFTTSAPQDVAVMVTALGAPARYVATLRTTCDDRASEMVCRSGNPAQFTRRGLAAGTYYVIVSGPTAAPANRFVLQLTIDPPTDVPGNDICSGATDVSAGGSFGGSTSACADDYAPFCGATATYPDIVYNLTLASPQDVTLDLASTAPTSYLDLRSGTCGVGMTSLRCVSGATGHVFSRSVPAGTYWILVDTSIEASTTLDVTLAPPTTPCGSAADVDIDYPGASTTFSTTLTGTTVGRPNDFVPGCRTASTAPDVPYRINVLVRSSFSAEITSAGWDTVLHMRSACETATSEIACDDDGGACSLCSRVPTTGTLTLEPGTYYLIMDGYYTFSGPYTIAVTATRL